MIKRLFLITALLISIASLVEAGTRRIPTGAGDQLASADYGGVDISSTTLLTLSSANVVIFAGDGVFQGILIDTFSVADIGTQILVRDTDTVLNTGGSFETGDQRIVVRLTTSSTNVSINPSYTYLNATLDVANWQWKPIYPVRMVRGLVIKASTNLIGRIRVLYTKFE